MSYKPVIFLILVMLSFLIFGALYSSVLPAIPLVLSTDRKLMPQYPDLDTKLRKDHNVCIKGAPLLTKEWIISHLYSFISVYNNRPVMSNYGGTRIMHQFALWCFIKWIQPEYIIESGIYKGMGTWIIRQAAPNAKIILLDPATNTTLSYRDVKYDTIYLTGSNFIDFNNVKWKELLDPIKTLVFIDDHQNPIRRILEAKQFGFKHLIFDDNYWIGGDTTSLKLSCSLVLNDFGLDGIYYKDRIGHALVQRNLTKADLHVILNTFENIIDIYYEFPMMWNSTVANTNRKNSNFIFSNNSGLDLLKRYGLLNFPPPNELSNYFNIAYVRLK